MKQPERSLPRTLLFVLALFLFGTVYGYFSALNDGFAARQIRYVRSAFTDVFQDIGRQWYVSIPAGEVRSETLNPDRVAPGLLMIAGVDADERNFISVIDRDATPIQKWQVDWFDIWGDTPELFPQGRVPQREPGTMIHGAVILPDGSVIFNFESLSTVRLSACGQVIWKLDNLGHHFITPDGDTFWVGSEGRDGGVRPLRPGHAAPFSEWAIQQVSMDGDILRTITVLDILARNNLRGLMRISTLSNDFTTVSGDTTHLNDVDIFPAGLHSDIFSAGDILLSLRNMNTVLVIDPQTLAVKFKSTGDGLRQHDADFAKGDKITIYDNNNVDPEVNPKLRFSRIVELDARTGKSRTLFKGEERTHFYSQTMGRHQILPNGNLLVLSSREGRAFEVDPQGRLVWDFHNNLDDRFAGLLSEATLLPESMDRDFFEQNRANCRN